MPLPCTAPFRSNPSTLTGDGRSTGRVRLLRTATYTVRVQGENDYVAQGPYRAWIYPINRAADSVSKIGRASCRDTGKTVETAGDLEKLSYDGTAGKGGALV